MAGLTYEEYLAYPLGVPVAEAEFHALEYHAEKQIDAATHSRIGRDSLPPAVKEAVALQVAYLAQNGGVDLALTGAPLAGETLGGYRYSTTARAAQDGGASALCPEARAVLWPTGLLFTGVRRWRP